MSSRDRIRQVKTTKLKHGADHYKKIGHLGGVKNPNKFTSESGRIAKQKYWDERKLKEKG